MSMKKLKYIELSEENKALILGNKIFAEIKGQREQGILYSFVEFADGKTSVVLFLEPHHSSSDIEIASARIAALNFFDRMYAMAPEDILVAA